MNKLSIVILAAGQSTRMKSQTPKVLHPLAGKPMVQYAVETAAELTSEKPLLVVGNGADQVRRAVGDQVTYVEQREQLGTGHALLQARPLLEGRSEMVAVWYADMSLLSADTLRRLIGLQTDGEGPITMLTVVADDPMGFGRILRDEAGRVLGIVEEAVATDAQKAIKELNCGVYCFDGHWLWPRLTRLPLSPKGEYYLTDIVAMAVAEGQVVKALKISDVTEVLGVNDRSHLAQAEAVVRQRINQKWMLEGVTLLAPALTFIDATVELGQDTVIYPNTYLEGATAIGCQCRLGPNTIVRDSTVGDGCTIEASVVEGAVLEVGADVGPFSHLRKGARLGRGAHVGNFAEIKNSYLGPGSKMGHFSYLGDATVGQDVNIGAGTITCNYDGQRKHPTIIEDGAFIGSDTMLVAPVRVGAGAKIGAGSVVTHDVPPGSVAYGVPARVKGEIKED